MKLKTKLILALLICSSIFSYTQDFSPFQINGELFQLPGKWDLKGLRKESGQYHFLNKKEQVSLLISVRNPDGFEFYNKDINEIELLDKFYRWDFDYWSSPSGGLRTETSEMKRDDTNKYIIWKLIVKEMPQNNNQDKISHFLYAVRNDKLIAISLTDDTDSKKILSESEKIKFLEGIYIK